MIHILSITIKLLNIPVDFNIQVLAYGNIENHTTYMVIIKSDRKNFAETMSEDEEKIMKNHFIYLKELLAKRKLVMADPSLDDLGGYIFLKDVNLKEAERLLARDPSIQSGVLTPEFHPFRISLCRCD